MNIPVSKYLIISVILTAIGLLFLVSSYEQRIVIGTITGSMLILSGLFSWPFGYFIKSLSEKAKNIDGEFWLSKGLARVGNIPIIQNKPLLRWIGINNDPVFEGAFILLLTFLIAGYLLGIGANTANVVPNISTIWSSAVTILVFYFVAIFIRNVGFTFQIYSRDGNSIQFNTENEKLFLNKTSKILGLIVAISLVISLSYLDYTKGVFPESVYAEKSPDSRFMTNLLNQQSFQTYLLSRIWLFTIGVLAGVLLIESLTIMRIFTKLNSEKHFVLLNPFIANPIKNLNDLLFGFWKASSSGLGYIPLVLLTLSIKDLLASNDLEFLIYITVVYSAFLTITFPFVLYKLSLIVGNGKEITIDMLKQDREKFLVIFPNKNSSESNIISEVRRVRDVPYRGLVMQVFQIIIAILIAVSGMKW